MARKKKFKIANSSQHDELEDERGKVKVMIRAVDEGGLVKKGNVTRTITLHDAKVSEVGDAVWKALNG